MKRSIVPISFLVFVVFFLLCFFLVQKANSQGNPGGALQYFVLYHERDSKGNKLYADSPKNTKPLIGKRFRIIENVIWDPDLVKDETKDWNGRYTKGPKKLKVENAKLPPGVPDFPFKLTIETSDQAKLKVEIEEEEENDMWYWFYYDDPKFEHTALKRKASKYWRANALCTFNNNCYGFATGYQYMISPRGLAAIVEDDAYIADNTLYCKANGIMKFKGDHALWIGECCGKECEPKEETLKKTWERNGCSVPIIMEWFCDKKTGGAKLENIETIYYKK